MSRDVELAILFADVVGSTQLYERLGDEAARRMVGQCLQIMREATEACGGTVIKTMGDEVMSTFPTADDAMNSAKRMQERIAAEPGLSYDGGHLQIRIGCHFGAAVQEHGDVFGSAVHTANRMTSQAKAGQIMTSAPTIEALSPAWQSMSRQIDIATMRGQSGEVALYEVIWQPDDATRMVETVDSVEVPALKRIRLLYQGRELVVDGKRQQATLGRSVDSDLVVEGRMISRHHARIEMARGRFTLIDQSVNGTHVYPKDGEEIFLRRDSAQLTGEGMLSLGPLEQSDESAQISYAVEE